jgi:addiction module HigA family antidote
MNRLEPITPGELLLEEFLTPMGITRYRLAKEIDVPAQRISEIVAGRRAITADTDLRLCRFFGLSGYWFAGGLTEVAERELGRHYERSGRGRLPRPDGQRSCCGAQLPNGRDVDRIDVARAVRSRALQAQWSAADPVPYPSACLPFQARGKALDRPLAIGACLPFQARGRPGTNALTDRPSWVDLPDDGTSG